MNQIKPNYNIPCQKAICTSIEKLYEGKLNNIKNYFKNISVNALTTDFRVF
jgi:hypothetical protein